MALPERCKGCTHYDKPGICGHPDPFPHIILILEGEACESFERNLDLCPGRDPLPCTSPGCDGDPQTNQYPMCYADEDCPGYENDETQAR